MKEIESIQPKTEDRIMSKWEARLVFYGVAAAMTSRCMINAEILKSLDEAKEVLNIDREDDKNQKPPKPPRRPNARIGGYALGNT
jgi:hypothetical protein